MTTNTTINYAKLADAAADTYTSARDALNRAADAYKEYTRGTMRYFEDAMAGIKNGLGTLGN